MAWSEREADVQLEVTVKDFLFGIPNTERNAKVINFILIFTKFFIYRQKLFHQGALELIQFLRELRKRLQVEKCLFTVEGKLQQFGKWSRIYLADPQISALD